MAWRTASTTELDTPANGLAGSTHVSAPEPIGGAVPASDESRITHHTSLTPRRHILDLDDFSVAEIADVLDTSAAMKGVLARRVKKVPALQGKTVLNVFYEASTRTRVSFELAAKHLSADVINMSASGSSVEKGESLVDTVRTLQAIGAD